MDSGTEKGERYEDEHVHTVYQKIASHFSSTRYKPWPLVEKFLRALPVGAVGLDIGCGNGKYLTVNPNIFIIGSDRSSNLVKIAAQRQPHEAVVADTLYLPHGAGLYDFAISIAVVHHLSTRPRRVEAVKAVLETLKPSRSQSTRPDVDTSRQHQGTALIYVWALEQRNSRRGWDEGDEQDVMVPWVMKQSPNAQKVNRKECRTDATKPCRDSDAQNNRTPEELKSTPIAIEDQVFHRYYHLYREGELEEDIVQAGGQVLSSGYERDNWWAIAARLEGMVSLV
jgi:tRNA (uracil-5-)-methyltransferase TRM9